VAGLRNVLTQALGSPVTVRFGNDGIGLPVVMAGRIQFITT
jgi:hypothetical protein